MTKVFKSFRFTLLGLAVAFSLLACDTETTKAKPAAAPAMPAVTVDAVVIKTQPIELATRLPGRTSAFRVAEVRPQVEGIVLQRLFVEGSTVKKGDVLFQIDPASYEVALDSAQATLASARAVLERAELQLNRYQALIKKRAISQQTYEDSQASYREAVASIMSAKAAVKSAQINLDYTKIKAPISGRIGLSAVTEGALVTANQTTYLAVIKQLDPLYVDISQSSSDLMKLRSNHPLGEKTLGAIQLSLDDGTPVAEPASLQFADVSVDQETGTVNLRALVPNPDLLLLPGMYVRAEVPTETRAEAILVPQRAVSRDVTGRAHVMLVNSKNVVEDQVVDAVRVVGTQWLIDAGLSVGDQVIVNGLQKVKPGSAVQLNILALDEGQ
ncbi:MULTISPECIES: efflux RND transporter periplasmic adaptor subunit [unclassified Agarivorans]|uniref:efflux RND transporter periplasmic adaptor subunit n=1 Tax=unclassified Agarivorans TaxID=2636026 RepID=UPI003D7DDA6C